MDFFDGTRESSVHLDELINVLARVAKHLTSGVNQDGHVTIAQDREFDGFLHEPYLPLIERDLADLALGQCLDRYLLPSHAIKTNR